MERDGSSLPASPDAGAGPAQLAREPRLRYGLAYTSFVVRMMQGQDIFGMKGAALPAETFVDLCIRAGADGCQIDLSQLESTDPDALARLRERIDSHGLFVELSIPARSLESTDDYQHAADVARALGASCLRTACLWGRRYDHFQSPDEWRAFVSRWTDVLERMLPVIERQRLPLGIENHKDWLAPELVALLQRFSSPWLGACVDFGNNLSLLEDPLETIETLAPFAVTTHLKDMAVERLDEGFALPEVPLGEGILPLAGMVGTLQRTRPEVHLCLEMITRDPLPVPCCRDAYWLTRTDGDRSSAERFIETLLASAVTAPLPRTTGLSPEAAVALEDEHVRRCTAYAYEVLGCVSPGVRPARRQRRPEKRPGPAQVPPG